MSIFLILFLIFLFACADTERISDEVEDMSDRLDRLENENEIDDDYDETSVF